MSVHVSSWVWKHAEAKGNELLVLLALADVADDEGNAWPSQSFLADRTRLSLATVKRAVRSLRDSGVLAADRSSGRANRYQIVSYLGQSDTGVKLIPVSPVIPVIAHSCDPCDSSAVSCNTSFNRQDTPIELTLEVPVGVVDRFAEFWKLWPRGEGKADAVKAWAKATKKVSQDLIVAAAARYVSSPDRPEPKFVPHASTWLNKERWADDGLAPASGGDKQARALALVGKYELEERRAEVGSGEVVGLVPGGGSSGGQRALGRGVV